LGAGISVGKKYRKTEGRMEVKNGVEKEER
jgi:hypothetical protein